MTVAGWLNGGAFTTEAGFDVLTVDGVAYSGPTGSGTGSDSTDSGAAGPVNVAVAAGSMITWATDGTNTAVTKPPHPHKPVPPTLTPLP